MRLLSEQREEIISQESAVAGSLSLDLAEPLQRVKAETANALAVELAALGLMPYIYSYGYYAEKPLLKVTYFSDISDEDLERLPDEFGCLPVEVAPATRARLERGRHDEARFYPIEEAFSEAFRRAVVAGCESDQALDRAVRAARALLP